MMSDPDVEFRTTGSKPHRETLKPLKKTAAPKVTLFTEGSLRKGDQAATWAFIMKTNSGEVLCKQKGAILGTAQTAEAKAIC